MLVFHLPFCVFYYVKLLMARASLVHREIHMLHLFKKSVLEEIFFPNILQLFQSRCIKTWLIMMPYSLDPNIDLRTEFLRRKTNDIISIYACMCIFVCMYVFMCTYVYMCVCMFACFWILFLRHHCLTAGVCVIKWP